jgi:hypothetical protein
MDKLINTKLTKEELVKWCEALESGEFKQCKYRLYDAASDGFCCIGVFGKAVLNLDNSGYATIQVAGHEFQNSYNHFGVDYYQYVALNDDESLTFPEIAAKIREDILTDFTAQFTSNAILPLIVIHQIPTYT